MISNFLQFLNQPYPYKTGFLSTIKEALISGLVVFAFLAFFQPFNLHTTGSKAPLIAFQFGIITFLVSIIFEFLINYVFKIKRDQASWTFWKWLALVLVLILFIASANYFYALIILNRDLNLSEFFVMLRSTVAVGIFPAFIAGTLNLNRKTKEFKKIAQSISPKEVIQDTSVNVFLPIKNSNKTFEIDASKILFLESMQNYVQIHYLDENEQPIKLMHRNTISALEEFLAPHGIKRSHRSYLINPSMIKEVSGNAQGLKLTLSHGEGLVPVSRKYISQFK